MKNAAATKTQLKSLRLRLAALEAQLTDETSQKFPAARRQVELEIVRVNTEIEAVEARLETRGVPVIEFSSMDHMVRALCRPASGQVDAPKYIETRGHRRTA